MPIVYANNGLFNRVVDPGYTVAAGEVMFADTATPDQLAAAFPGYAAAQASIQLNAKIAALEAQMTPRRVRAIGTAAEELVSVTEGGATFNKPFHQWIDDNIADLAGRPRANFGIPVLNANDVRPVDGESFTWRAAADGTSNSTSYKAGDVLITSNRSGTLTTVLQGTSVSGTGVTAGVTVK